MFPSIYYFNTLNFPKYYPKIQQCIYQFIDIIALLSIFVHFYSTLTFSVSTKVLINNWYVLIFYLVITLPGLDCLVFGLRLCLAIIAMISTIELGSSMCVARFSRICLNGLICHAVLTLYYNTIIILCIICVCSLYILKILV